MELEVVYSGALERDYIRSQQRPAVPLDPFGPRLKEPKAEPTRRPKHREAVLGFLSCGGWASIHDIAIGTS